MQFFSRREIAALKPRRSLRLIGALVGMALLGALVVHGVSAAAATATATATATPTTYYACVSPAAGGHISMTTAGGTCPPPDTKISWNQTGPVGPSGPQGPAGPVGPQGPQGPAGATQTARTQLVTAGADTTIPPFGGILGSLAICPAGTVVTGGGYVLHAIPQTGWSVLASTEGLGANPNDWLVQMNNSGTTALSFVAVAVCLTLS